MPRCTGSVTRPDPIESRGQAAADGGPRPFAGRWDDFVRWFLLGLGQWLGTRGGDSSDRNRFWPTLHHHQYIQSGRGMGSYFFGASTHGLVQSAHRAHLHTHLTLTLALLTSTRINLPATFDTRAPRAQDWRLYPSRAARQRHSGSRSRFQRFLECRACIWVINALSTCTVNKIFGLQLVRKVRAHPTNTTAQPACPLSTLCLAFAIASTPIHNTHCLTAVWLQRRDAREAP